MKTTILILLTALFLVSCTKSNEAILNEVSSNLNTIETIKYLSTIEVIDNGEVINKTTDTLSFDFTNDLKYHFSAINGELIYNGERTFYTIPEEKLIITSEDNRPESVNNPLYLTLNPLKYVLPKLIMDKDVILSRKNDTIINSTQHYVFSFLLEKKYIDWVASDFKQDIDYDSEYILMVDKTNNFPYKLISPNGKDGSVSRTIESIELDKQFSDKLWTGKNLPKDYAKFTQEEYYANRENNMLSHLGKKLTDWELPELKNDVLVNPSKLKGNVILLEFWFKNCGGCLVAIPSLNAIKTRFENENFKLYGIEFIEDVSKEMLGKYVKEQNILFPNLYKGKTVASNFGIRGAPTFMLIDKTGTIIHINTGFTKDIMDEIISKIEKNI